MIENVGADVHSPNNCFVTTRGDVGIAPYTFLRYIMGCRGRQPLQKKGEPIGSPLIMH
jgi:hypothetical protein